MTKLFIDTNIVIDLLAKRDPFYQDAAILFSKADKAEVKLMISALTFANTNYILSKVLSAKQARVVLRQFKVLVEIVALDDKQIDLALSAEKFTDFEDGLQYYAAVENSAAVIITRNKTDFGDAKIPVMSAKEYLAKLNNETI